MPDCVCLSGCPFFHDRMANMPGMAEMLKTKYCKSEYENCARYMVFSALGKDAVPMDMFPNQQDRAQEMIDGK